MFIIRKTPEDINESNFMNEVRIRRRSVIRLGFIVLQNEAIAGLPGAQTLAAVALGPASPRHIVHRVIAY